MTAEKKLAQKRLTLLQLAERLRNVSMLELGLGHANILIIHHRRSKKSNVQRQYCLFRPRKEPYSSRVPPGADGLPSLL